MELRKKMERAEGLTASERAAADYILKNEAEIGKMPLTALAKSSFSSNSTLIRLCRKLGFHGYKDFQLAWMLELRERELSEQDNRFQTVWLCGERGLLPAAAEFVRRLSSVEIRYLETAAAGETAYDLSRVNGKTDMLMLAVPSLEDIQKLRGTLRDSVDKLPAMAVYVEKLETTGL